MNGSKMDYYLDNIFMYGKQAKDISLEYRSAVGEFEDITHRDEPLRIMNEIRGSCRNFYPANQDEYLRKELQRESKRSKFPLGLFFLIILGTYLLLHLVAYIKKGYIVNGAGNELAMLFGSFLVAGLPAGIILLIRGGMVRDNPDYQYMQRAFSSDVCILPQGLAVITHAADYPKYERLINPAGQFMTPEVYQSYLQLLSRPGPKSVSEKLQFEKYYDPARNREFPFNQCFILDRISYTEKCDGYMRIVGSCHIYSLARKPLAQYLNDTNVRTIISRFHFYLYGYKPQAEVIVPLIKDPEFGDMCNRLQASASGQR